jgi:Ca2+-binding EF-hand superfamily protein
MLVVLRRLIKFGKLKLAEIQLGVLVFMINFVINIENEETMIRCFHLIDSQGDGVITVPELVQAMIEFMDRPQKLAESAAKEVLNKIDFNLSKDISYSGTAGLMQSFWWQGRTWRRC